jgi:ribosomal protein S12 methylthiotransferase accessory factor
MRIRFDDSVPDANFRLLNAHVTWGDGSESQGWGRDECAAVAQRKAIAEAVERGAFARLPKAARFTAGEDTFIHPDQVIRYSAYQYAVAGFPFRPFNSTQQNWWLPARSATDGHATFVLADCVCSPRAFEPAYRRRLVTYASTSGCASGVTWDDAMARATLELVERDAFMRHWLAQRPGEPIEPASLPGWAAERHEHLTARNCKVAVQHLTLGSHPVWMVVAQHEGRNFTTVGTASGFDADQALHAAWYEMETPALARLAGVSQISISPECVKTPADHAALYATKEFFRSANPVLWSVDRRRSYESLVHAFESDASSLYDHLHRQGHPVYGVDLSLEEAQTVLNGEPVYSVRAIAPGLIPVSFGYGMLPLGMVSSSVHPSMDVHPLC